MKNGEQNNTAHALVNVLEKNGVNLIFGHPGEQILSFYEALRTSSIKHVLMRHEQGAAHAADGYARASGHLGVCVATAGPGALNLVMGVATAYKDSVPLLVITGDVATSERGADIFQDLDLCAIFKPITLKSFYPENGHDAILKLNKAIHMLKNGPTGPIHLNLPKDILMETLDLEKSNSITDFESSPAEYSVENSVNDKIPVLENKKIEKSIEWLKNSKKPLIIVGTGTIWSHALKEIKEFLEKNEIPLSTTYPARGVISEDHPLCLGLIGTRGTPVSNYAGKNCDLILGLGCRFSERTRAAIGDQKIIHVNIDPEKLKGDLNLEMDVKKFLNEISHIKLVDDNKNWWSELNQYSKNHPSQYNIDFEYLDTPLKPQQAIKEIINASPESIIVNDAGTHTTWLTLYKKVSKPCSLLFSGAFGPMGYGLPAGIGAALAKSGESVVVITGDGGFQMNLQELATLHQEDLPLVICIINNQSLGIIRQWQELYHGPPYQVHLDNPDFTELAHSYKIKSIKVDRPGEVSKVVQKSIESKKPVLIEIIVDPHENIPLPQINII